MCTAEIDFFRVEHMTKGLGLCVEISDSLWAGGCDLWQVEFDSGESCLVFSTACKLETDSEDVLK